MLVFVLRHHAATGMLRSRHVTAAGGLDSSLSLAEALHELARRGRGLSGPFKHQDGVVRWQLESKGLPPAFTAMFCANVIHIAPWPVAQGIFAAAGRHLEAHGRLLLYGPFRRDGVHNSPGNETFDEDLRRDNPEWGVRDTADLKKLGEANGLRLAELVEMPANNAMLVFTRS